MKLILSGLFILTAHASASNCLTFKGLTGEHKLCWSDKEKAWLSESCQKTCQAKTALAKKYSRLLRVREGVGSRNTSTIICEELKLPVLILRDEKSNEQSFCQFQDKSLVDANALSRKATL